MHAYDIVGYTFDGAAYCVECAEASALFDGGKPDGEWVPIFASDEWDSAPTCYGCGEAIEDVTIIGADPDEARADDYLEHSMAAWDEAHYGKHAPEGNGDSPWADYGREEY
jgi:hypothetical protein